MTYRVHEVHPSLIHAPLVLLPTAALVDLAAARSRSPGMARVGKALWVAATAGAALAGISGFASASEVRHDDPHAEDMMFLHGVANTIVLVGAALLTATRVRRRRPSLLGAAVGLVASGAALYTAFLGGEMVYEHGVGVVSMPEYLPDGVSESPALLSPEGPKTFLRDIGKGIAWIVDRGKRALTGARPTDRSAFAG